MKLRKIVLPLALGLAAIFIGAGCKHGFNGQVTTLHGHRPEAVANPGPEGTIPPGNPLPPGGGMIMGGVPIRGTGPDTQKGGGELPDSWTPADMNQDREKLAADTVHFKFDSAAVQDDQQAKVANVAEALAHDLTAKLLIEGNCDERGTEEYNRALGERRALALREALAKTGIDPARIRTISYGKDKPADPGHDESAFAKNLRGDFVLCHPKTGV